MKHFITALLFFLLSAAALHAQGVVQSLTPEQRERIQAKLPELRRELQPMSTEARAQRVTEFFEQFEDISAEQRRGLGEVILQQTGEAKPVVTPAENPFNKSLTALTDFGDAKYLGKTAGLYPGGANERPAKHTEAGLRIAREMRPLDKNGNVDEADGKIVWLSIGMSNTTQETQAFLARAKNAPGLNPKLALVDGAFGGQAINQIVSPDAPYWNNIVEQRLKSRGLSPEQVQVVWFKQAEMGPSDTNFETYPVELKAKYAEAMRVLKRKFPNLKLVYLSPRIYAGYAKTRLNPEPFAWYTGWAIKFLIEDQLAGEPELRFDGDDAPAAWLSWGPYLWANGETPNAGGLSYEEADLSSDGTHPSPAGQRKVAEALFRFFMTDETAKVWFIAP